METLRTILTQFTDETIGILLAVLAILLATLVSYWLYNRKKFRELSHQIPASVVKSYLDSIISNSTALKSSLFRGGGLDIGNGIPSVLPAESLPSGGAVVAGVSQEELSQKNAEISALRSTLSERDGTISELEKLLVTARENSGNASSGDEALKKEIESLKIELEKAKAELAAAGPASSASGDGALESQLQDITKERDELKERLMEYEIIEEDLANLKKFQQENAELKETIEKMKGGAPVAEPIAEDSAPEKEAVSEPTEAAAAAPEPPAEVTANENPAADDTATTAAAKENPEVPSNEGEQKSAEELLSEFEKMLG